MTRQVFYSFDYDEDAWRTSEVRNIGVVEGNTPVFDNEWETIRERDNITIQNWIDRQLKGRSCTIVLIGKNTSSSGWVHYEIKKSWDEEMGVLGIFIHNLLDSDGHQSNKGNNPFDYNYIDGYIMSRTVKTYDPPFTDSKSVYNDIARNIRNWVEEAIGIRNMYSEIRSMI